MTSPPAARADGALRIALDGAFLDYPASGIGTYVRCLHEALVCEALELGIVPTLLRPGRATTRLRRGGLGRFVWDIAGVAGAATASRPRPDLLHLPQMSSPIVTPVPTVVTVHDVIPLILPDYRSTRAMQVYLALMARTACRSRMIITPSEATADDLVRLLDVPRGRIVVIPLAPAPELQPDETGSALPLAQERFGIPGSYAFHIGGFDRRKNLPLLVEAFADALPRLPEKFSLVIGGAPHSGNATVFPPLAPVIRRHGLERRVLLVGRVSDIERRTLYQGASFTVAPSMYEGFGLTALESMACATPVIAANRTSFPEVVGDAGLLVEPAREALVTAMVRLATDVDLARRLAAAGHQRSMTFTWDAAARRTVEVYHAALADSTR